MGHLTLASSQCAIAMTTQIIYSIPKMPLFVSLIKITDLGVTFSCFLLDEAVKCSPLSNSFCQLCGMLEKGISHDLVINAG